MVDIVQILAGNLSNRNIIDIYFIFVNQMQEQIQGSLKMLKLVRNLLFAHTNSPYVFSPVFIPLYRLWAVNEPPAPAACRSGGYWWNVFPARAPRPSIFRPPENFRRTRAEKTGTEASSFLQDRESGLSLHENDRTG